MWRAAYEMEGGTLVAVAAVDDDPVAGAPSLALLALEMRAWPELGLFLASWPLWLAQPRGDGHPVLVLPPFGATDAYTSPLRAVLRVLGYSSHGWGLGQNLGPTAAILDGGPKRLLELAERTGRKVSVIGWSAGGILGREAARHHPEAVRQVITLGSPFRLLLDDRYKTHAAFFYKLAERWHAAPTEPMLQRGVPPATARGSRHRHLHAHRRCHQLAVVPRGRRSVLGEHRGVRQSLRARAQPGGGHRHHRPARTARR